MATTSIQSVSTVPLLAEAGQAAAALKSLAHEGRLLVLCYLAEAGELSAGDLTRRVGLSQSAMSQHLARLRDDSLVATRRDAQTVYYRIADARVNRLLALLKDLYCPELSELQSKGPAQ